MNECDRLLKFKSFHEISESKMEWLWRGRIPRGVLVGLIGMPGVGKSLICVDIASRITKGVELPFDSTPRDPENVLWISAEEDASTIIKPRLGVAGAVMSKVFFFTGADKCDSMLALPLV